MRPDRAENILDILARSGGKLTDATHDMSHEAVAAAAAHVNAILNEQNVGMTDCVAFTCRNDVPSAVALLGLLASFRTFILLPRAAPAGPSLDADAPETFCRYRLKVGGPTELAGASIPGLPDISIVVSDNPNWRGDLPAGPARFFAPTSGSTGRVKLVQHRHDRLLQAALNCAERLGMAASDRVALPVPIAHMFGFGAAFLPAVLVGASIDLQPEANVLRYLARERQFDPTVAFLTPSFGQTVLRVRKMPRSYRLTVMAGDRLTADLFDQYERLHGCLVNLYGSTELGVIAAGDPADPAALRRDVIGRPLPGVTITHADQAAGLADPAAPGMLWFQHRYGFECYADSHGREIRQPDDSLASGEHFSSNDMGRLIDGYLMVHGRADDLVNRDGLLVVCSDVAAALRTIDGIAEAIVLGGAPTRRGQALIAFCVLETQRNWQAAPLRRACLGILPSRAIPDEFVFLPDLPRLPSGKVNRVELARGRASF